MIATTPEELMAKGLWDAACDVTGISAWSVNEGLMGDEEEIILTKEEAQEIGLLRKRNVDESIERGLEVYSNVWEALSDL